MWLDNWNVNSFFPFLDHLSCHNINGFNKDTWCLNIKRINHWILDSMHEVFQDNFNVWKILAFLHQLNWSCKQISKSFQTTKTSCCIKTSNFIFDGLNNQWTVTCWIDISAKHSVAKRHMMLNCFVVFVEDWFVHCYKQVIKILCHELFNITNWIQQQVCCSLLMSFLPCTYFCIESFKISSHIWSN